MLISLIIPCYNEEETLKILYANLNSTAQIMKEYDFEFIFINDGSKDNTLSILKKLAKADSRVIYIYHFQEILEKNLQCMRDFAMHMVIILLLWMRICKTLHRFCHKWLKS